MNCRCVKINGQRVDVQSVNLAQHVDTTMHGDDCYATLVLRGSLADYHILAIKKPKVRAKSQIHKIKHGRIAKQYKLVSDKIQQTKSFRRAERITKNNRILAKEPKVETTHINVTSRADVAEMVSQLAQIPRGHPSPQLGFDLEAWDLGRHGTNAYMQLRDYTKKQTYLIDLYHLEDAAFKTPASKKDNTTLRSIMEDPEILMLIVDSRSDADALNWFYGVKVRGVIDLQIVNILTESLQDGMYLPQGKKFDLIMLGVKYNGGVSEEEYKFFHTHKDYNFKQHVDRYRQFLKRPLLPALKIYAVNDVLYLDRMYASLTKHMTQIEIRLAREWSTKTTEETWSETWVRAGGANGPRVQYRRKRQYHVLAGDRADYDNESERLLKGQQYPRQGKSKILLWVGLTN
ncbi:hypothetical protein LTR66_017780, partial [Elasticomyces elasticus]